MSVREDQYVQVDGCSKVLCGGCGNVYGFGETPACPHGRMADTKAFVEYWDEHVAPPPNHFAVEGHARPLNVPLPEYHPDRGYRVTSLGDRHKLMKLGHTDYRGTRGKGER